MLGQKYLKLGGVSIPTPIDFTENYTDIENIGNAESGRDLVMVTRLQKRSWTLTCQVSSYWLDELKTLCAENSTTLVFRGESIPVRARLTGSQMAQYSYMNPESNGYYTVSMTITEI